MTIHLADKMEALAISEGRVVRDTVRPRPGVQEAPGDRRGSRAPRLALRKALDRLRVSAWAWWVGASALGYLLGLGVVGLGAASVALALAASLLAGAVVGASVAVAVAAAASPGKRAAPARDGTRGTPRAV